MEQGPGKYPDDVEKHTWDLKKLNAMVERGEMVDLKGDDSLGDRMRLSLERMNNLSNRFYKDKGDDAEIIRQEFDQIKDILEGLQAKILKEIEKTNSDKSVYFEYLIKEIQAKQEKLRQKWQGLKGVNPEEIGLDQEIAKLQKDMDQIQAAKTVAMTDIESLTPENFQTQINTSDEG